MTDMTYIATLKRPAPEIVGPYSPWPRNIKPRRRRAYVYAAGVAAVAIFAHCGVPLLV